MGKKLLTKPSRSARKNISNQMPSWGLNNQKQLNKFTAQCWPIRIVKVTTMPHDSVVLIMNEHFKTSGVVASFDSQRNKWQLHLSVWNVNLVCLLNIIFFGEKFKSIKPSQSAIMNIPNKMPSWGLNNQKGPWLLHPIPNAINENFS